MAKSFVMLYIVLGTVLILYAFSVFRKHGTRKIFKRPIAVVNGVLYDMYLFSEPKQCKTCLYHYLAKVGECPCCGSEKVSDVPKISKWNLVIGYSFITLIVILCYAGVTYLGNKFGLSVPEDGSWTWIPIF